ncbi:MAG: arylsulfatase [Verrucomicrobia bacterium]|nr:arylsulfatase [Verrucomicrobiota bacterium]
MLFPHNWIVAAISLLTLGWHPLGAVEPGSLWNKRPNIIFIITDDQGYGDASCHGNPVLKTPWLDRLHSESARFTDFHVSPTCSPTRSALITGRHEFRNGVTHTILERERLTLRATTLAQILARSGYRTGIFGKWHLGDEARYQPNRRGFQEVFIHGGGGIGQTFPGSCGDAPGNTYFDPAILHNGRFARTRGYCTDVFFNQAMSWMKAQHQEGPVFAWIACNAPHVPLQVRPEDEARYSGKHSNTNAVKFMGMVANIDDNLGRLLRSLNEWGIEQETLVIYMTDNGADAGSFVWDGGMRGKKGTAFLGGTRAISFWRWPGSIQPGDRKGLTAHIDVFPTLASIAGVSLDPRLRKQVEGRDLGPLLVSPQAPWADRVLFTHLGRWEKGASPDTTKYRQCAVRTSRWQLVSAQGAREPRWMLFDVSTDYSQQTDVLQQHPQVAAELSGRFEHWWEGVQPLLVNERARGPAENPFKVLYRKQPPSASDTP